MAHFPNLYLRSIGTCKLSMLAVLSSSMVCENVLFLIWFEYGSEADYIFNEWWMIYRDFKLFNQFASAEKAWLQIL